MNPVVKEHSSMLEIFEFLLYLDLIIVMIRLGRCLRRDADLYDLIGCLVMPSWLIFTWFVLRFPLKLTSVDVLVRLVGPIFS
jgi:hypothetical protein